ncbi:hypothetical protein H5410_010756 [Solanum commersonii]|uniref:Uncharacterized protein n=1 Tax=Solanum commersonii TaxID=4109 RepID=A0A9J6AN37_SOLCO|nr:hypothetical protein H5410_010756 [Solanum commersonii]
MEMRLDTRTCKRKEVPSILGLLSKDTASSIEFDQLCCMGWNVRQGGANLYLFSSPKGGIEEKVCAYTTEARREKGTKGAYASSTAATGFILKFCINILMRFLFLNTCLEFDC